MTKHEPLRLLAEDQDDLGGHLRGVAGRDRQGRRHRVGRRGRRFTLALNRYLWEVPGGLLGNRVRAGLQFGSVLAVKSRNLRRDPPDAVIELLAVRFEPGEAPGGRVRLAFAGGGDLELTVECVDAALADISAPWPTPSTPAHEERADKPLEFLRRDATERAMRRFVTPPGFRDRVRRLPGRAAGMPADVDEAVAAVLEAVLSEGVDAVLRYTERFDRVRLTEDKLQVTPREIQAGVDACPAEVREAISRRRN